MLLEKQNSKLLILHYNPFFLHILCRELPKAETTCFSLMKRSPTMLCFGLFLFVCLSQQVCTHQSKMLSTRITRLNLYRKGNIKNHFWFSAGAREIGSPGIQCAGKTLHHWPPTFSPGVPDPTILISSTFCGPFPQVEREAECCRAVSKLEAGQPCFFP